MYSSGNLLSCNINWMNKWLLENLGVHGFQSSSLLGKMFQWSFISRISKAQHRRSDRGGRVVVQAVELLPCMHSPRKDCCSLSKHPTWCPKPGLISERIARGIPWASLGVVQKEKKGKKLRCRVLGKERLEWRPWSVATYVPVKGYWPKKCLQKLFIFMDLHSIRAVWANQRHTNVSVVYIKRLQVSRTFRMKSFLYEMRITKMDELFFTLS